MDDNGWIALDTGSLDGKYFISNDGDTWSDISFQVATQDLTAEWDPETVENAGSDTTSDLTVESSSNDYTLIIERPSGLSDADMMDIFSGGSYDTGDDEYTYTVSTTDFTTTADFTDIDTGDYDFTLVADETGAETNAAITVEEEAQGEVTLDQSVYTQERGDYVEFTVSLEDTTSGYVNIGSAGVGYNETFVVDDDNEDGEVTFAFNTYNQDVSTIGDSADNDDTVSLLASHDNELTASDVLDEGDYDVLSSTSVNGNDYVDNEDDVATISLQEEFVEGVSTWTVPGTANYDSDELSMLEEDATQTDSIAKNDKLVIALNAGGLFGQVEEGNLDDLNQTLANGGPNMTIVESDPGPNQDAETYYVSDVGTQMLFDEENNLIYVVANTGDLALGSSAADKDYDVEFEINENNNLVDDPDQDPSEEYELTASQTFTLEQRDASFDGLTADDVLEVEAVDGATITGTTNVAPGTELNVRMKKTGDNPFLETADMTVADDGTWEASFDMASYAVDSEFTATVRLGGTVISDEVDGLIIEEEEVTTPTPTTTTTPEPTTTTTTTTTEQPATPTPTEVPPTTTTTTTETPGFGIAVAILALIGAALVALRRRN